MKRITVIFLLCWAIVFANAQSPVFQWAKGIGGTSSDYGSAIDLDGMGNVYTTGYFQGTADFDPGTGTYTLASGSNVSMFVSKLDPNGNFIWAKQLTGSTIFGGSYSIVVDMSGNSYVVGRFRGTVDFDPGPAVFNLNTTNDAAFICKLDVFGSFVWAKKVGGTSASADWAHSIALDASSNVYITGHFGNTVDFDPGVGTYTLTSVGIEDAFILKLDVSGNFIWARRIGGGSNDTGEAITIDPSGNVLTTGTFNNTADFDPGPGTFTLSGIGDIFISKLDQNGNFVWAKQIGMNSSGDNVTSICTDIAGNVYTSGFFNGNTDFDPGSTSFTIAALGTYDSFISKLDGSGNFIWAKTFGGSSSISRAYKINIDLPGNVYVTGYLNGTVDFDPGPASYTISPMGNYDTFISKLDSAGNFIWVKNFGGIVSSYGMGIVIDSGGSIYSIGGFSSTVDFDPDGGVFNLTSYGAEDVYIHKMSSAVGVKENEVFSGNNYIFPNPASSSFNIELNQVSQVTIINILGEEVLSYKARPGKNTFDISSQTTGIYFVKISTSEKQQVFKLLKE